MVAYHDQPFYKAIQAERERINAEWRKEDSLRRRAKDAGDEDEAFYRLRKMVDLVTRGQRAHQILMRRYPDYAQIFERAG